MAAIGVVREALERHIAPAPEKQTEHIAEVCEVHQALKEAASAMPSPPALEMLCKIFRLSAFERDLLLLCAGVELDSSFASVCANAQGDPARSSPTLSLGLAVL